MDDVYKGEFTAYGIGSIKRVYIGDTSDASQSEFVYMDDFLIDDDMTEPTAAGQPYQARVQYVAGMKKW